MLHRHHASRHLLGFLTGVILVGASLGSTSAIMGHTVFLHSNAFGIKDLRAMLSSERRERIEQSIVNRRSRREDRLQQDKRTVKDIGSIVPMRNTSYPFKGTRSWDVALNTATLVYERFGIAAPIGRPSPTYWNNRDWRSLEDQMQYLLLNGLAIYPHSPNPGEGGSMIIAGHSSPPTMDALGSPYEAILSSLPNAKVGDVISVFDTEGNHYNYTIQKTQVVPATYTKLLLQNPEKKELVLFTCYPVGTTRERFVVWADLNEESTVVSVRK